MQRLKFNYLTELRLSEPIQWGEYKTRMPLIVENY